MWKTVLFDFDGTLLDTGEGIKSCLRHALEKIGRPIDPSDNMDRYIGPPFKESLRDFAGLTDEEMREATRLYREEYASAGFLQSYLYPGMKTVLETLKAENIRLGIVSSKPESMIRSMVEYFGLNDIFDLIIGSDPAGILSRKADLIGEALKRLDLTEARNSVVYVGDRKYDMIGASLQRIPMIGVLYGYGSFEELTAYQPDRLASSPMMLLSLIEKENKERPDEGGAEGGRKPDSFSDNPEACSEENFAPDPVRAPEGGLMRVWRLVYPVLIYLGIANAAIYIFSMIFAFAAALQGSLSEAAVYQASILGQGIGEIITIPVLIIFFRRDAARRCFLPMPQGIYQKRVLRAKEYIKPMITTLLLILFAGTVAGTAAGLVSLITPDTAYEESEQIIVSVSVVWQLLIVGIFGPVVEELIFRGLLHRRLRDYNLGKWPAILVSSAAFGVFHMNLTQGIFAFLMGILFALVYEKYGSILFPILAHSFNNIWATLVSAYAPSNAFVNTIFFLLICIAGTIVMLCLMFRKKERKKEAGYPWGMPRRIR